MANLTAVIGADISGLERNINSAKQILSKYASESKNAANNIRKMSGVTDNQVASYRRVVKALEKVQSGTLTTAQASKTLERQVQELRIQWANLSDSAKTSDFGKAVSDSLRAAERQLEQFNEQLNQTRANGKRGITVEAKTKTSVKDELGQLSQRTLGVNVLGMTKMAAVAGGLVLVGHEIQKSTKLAIEFEDALSNLSAITGMQGDNLLKLREQIENTGRDTSTAVATIADAYTKVGSKMPELLKQPEALDAVTRAVITLSKAARMDLDSATESLTGIMNQLGAEASDANRYINVLAAGAKEGSGDIKYLSSAFTTAGGAINAAGLSIEQGTALIEVLAQKMPSAASAGEKLKSMLLKLVTGADEFNPKVVGMNTALENLSKHANDASFMIKMFGSDNYSAAMTLVTSAQKADELTKALTGTSEAQKQADVQTNNVKASLARLNTNWNNFITSLNNSQGALKKTIDLLDKVIQGWQWALFAKSNYEKAGDRGVSKAKEKSDTIKQEVITKFDDPEKALQEYKRRMQAVIKDYRNIEISSVQDSQGATKNGDRARARILKNVAHTASQAQKEAKALIAAAKASDFERPTKPKETTTKTTNTNTNTKTTSTNTSKSLSANETAIKKYEEQIRNIKALTTDGIITEKQANIKTIEEQTKLIKVLEENWNNAKQSEKEYYATVNVERTENIVKTSKVDVVYDVVKVPEIKFDKLELPEFETDSLDDYANRLKELTELLDKLSIGSAAYNTIQEKINKLEDEKASKTEKNIGLTDKETETVDMLGDAFRSLGNIGTALEIPELNIAGVIGQAVANLVLSYSEAMKLASTLGPIGWLGFGATGLAELATIVSSVKSMGTYAGGGIIKGATSIGDYNVARVNSGEIIMNGSQQQRLWNIINGTSPIYNQTSTMGGDVKFRIDGTDLIGIQKNYYKKQSRL